MEDKDKHKIVQGSVLRLVKQPCGLVQRGLDDLSKLLGTKGRVLLVNDVEGPFRDIEQILVANEYEVRSTCSPQNAIEIANGFEPEVIMLGLTMPVTLGGELFKLPFCSRIVLWG